MVKSDEALKSTYNLSEETMLILELNSELRLFIYSCSSSKVNPCPAEPGYTLSLQTV